MKKILVILPFSIAGTLIMNGFADGFKKIGYKVLSKDVRELTVDLFESYKPDYVLGFSYGYLFNEKISNYLNDETIRKKIKFIHYFADEPDSKFAYGTDHSLFNKLKNKEDSFIFIWDKEYLNVFKNSQYLPLGVNVDLYNSEFQRYKYSITFVGRPLTDKRQKILSAIIKRYSNKLKIFCYENHFEKSIIEIKEKNLLTPQELDVYVNSYKGFVEKEEDLSEIYNSTKININITEQGKNNMNYRIFEVGASKGFLLTDYMDDISLNFKEGFEIEIYRNMEELFDKIDFYLKNLNTAYKIAQNCYMKILKEHTFYNRAKTLDLYFDNLK